MNFDENDEIKLLRETVRKFVEQELPREEARRLDQEAIHAAGPKTAHLSLLSARHAIH